MTTRRLQVLVLLALISIAMTPPAAAHAKSVSYSDWSLAGDGVVTARIRVPARQMTLLQPESLDQSLSVTTMNHFRQNMSLHAGDSQCVGGDQPRRLRGVDDMLVFEIDFACPDGDVSSLVIKNDAFFGLAAGHTHFFRSHISGGAAPKVEGVLTADNRSAALSDTDNATLTATGPWRFLSLGVTHILSGWDHLLFIAGLMLIARRAQLWVLITGFTLGHSVSLAAATLGVMTVSARSAEALIAYSIFLIGSLALRESGLRKDISFPVIAAFYLLALASADLAGGNGFSLLFWTGLGLLTFGHVLSPVSAAQMGWQTSFLIAAGLGLAHGFGFASALREAFSDSAGLFASLFMFNIGVEVGQIAFVCAVSASVLWLRRIPAALVKAGSVKPLFACVITFTGSFWFAERTIAG